MHFYSLFMDFYIVFVLIFTVSQCFLLLKTIFLICSGVSVKKIIKNIWFNVINLYI